MLGRYHKVALSLTKFKNLFGLYKNPKPNFGWFYFVARPKRTMFGEYPNNVKGWKRKFFFISGVSKRQSSKGSEVMRHPISALLLH